MSSGKLSDFSRNRETSLVPREDPSDEDKGPSLRDRVREGVRDALNTAKNVRKKEEDSMSSPEMLKWVMDYLSREQEGVRKRDSASLKLIEEVLKSLRETTKEQKQLNALVEESMELLVRMSMREDKRTQVASWWGWIRDVIVITAAVGIFIRTGKAARMQEEMSGRDHRNSRLRSQDDRVVDFGQ